MTSPTNSKSKRPDGAPESEISVQHAKGGVFDRDGHSPFPIVGIGASAGGLDAFRQLLGALPAYPGMAFVLVQHLAPHYESRLSELLARVTPIPVEEATHGRRVEVDHVYVIPPNANLSIVQGVLHVTPRPEGHGAPYLPIDFLFRSLAEDQRGRSIGVVLSGTGSDGTLGLCEIKAVGGITFAQDDTSAAHSGMPISARDSGCADFILDPVAIAERLVATRAHPYLAVPPSVEDAQLEQEPDEDYRRILTIVRRIVGVDFQLYRRSTIRRRIMRRMALRALQKPSEYVRVLEREKDEVVALYHDLLINVTSFFRDPEMFEALKQHAFPDLASRKAPTQPYRIWVPGCSTGQEAYSLAITLLEFLDTQPTRPAIQIFATDLSDPTALDKARSGVFPETIEAEVSPERLRRFFNKGDHVYRVDKSIRDMCVFARQNVTADPPFSHVDLISCRNVLIYLSTPLQKRVIPTFHYALDVPGFLVLGSAETIGEHGELFELFELVDRSYKIYAKKPVAIRPMAHFASDDLRAASGTSPKRAHAPMSPLDLHKEADRILLGRFAPPAVLVSNTFEIVQYRGKTSPYLEPPPGEPTANILKMAREGLFLELRSALSEAKKSGKIIKRKEVRVVSDYGSREITLEILPVKSIGDDEGCFLVVFHDPQAMAKSAAALAAAAAALAATDLGGELEAPAEGQQGGTKREVERLRQELIATKEYLQSLVEQQDAANEELRSANEEILSSNEELQSTNEELETAKEELQSTNEELTTVNEQLQHRNIELTQLNNDLTNLLSSTNFPLVMVGSDLRIRRFTAAAKRLMNLLPTDIGRPIGDIRTIADIGDFDALIADVIDRVRTAEREIVARDGRWYTLRVAPYRTNDNKIEGAVVMLVDIDQIRRGQEELKDKNATLREQGALIEMSHDAIIVRDANHRVVFWNHGAEEMYGYAPHEARGRGLPDLLGTPAMLWDEINKSLRSTGAWEGELRQKHLDGTDLTVYSREILLSAEDPNDFRILAIKRNITEDKRMVSALKRADRQKDRFMATLAHELRNPIAPMKNAVEIMRLAGDNSFTMEQVREMLDRQVRQLSGIVEDLIDVSRIVERKIELRLERVPIETVVRTAVETSRSLIEACGHSFTLDLPPKPMYVDADPVRLSQVLVNLLNNAAKFTPTGGKILLRAESVGRDHDHEVVVRIRDTGVGIDDELKSRLFDMFEQGKAAPEHGMPGLGVGLSLVGSLVQMHGGTVIVVSEGAGRGSEFIVRLPEADPNDPAPWHEERGTQAVGAAARARAEKILIVDDNRDQADSLGKVLQLLGHTVRLSYDGEEALRVASEFLPDAVLLDLGLPLLSGYEVAERIRSHPKLKDVLLIAQTGWGQEQDRRRTRDAGFDHHLVKPVDVFQVQRILSTPRNGNLQQEHN